MRIDAIKYGESVFGEHHIFMGGDPKVLLPISFTIYLIRSEGRTLLVDAGCDDGAGFVMSVFERPSVLLERLGVPPDDVTDVLLTHAHHDHVEAVHHYKNATVHLHREEYPTARRYIPNGTRISLFDREAQITSEVCFRWIGGHSRGSSIVLVGDYVLCGDECYYERCLRENMLTGASCDRERSRRFLEEYRKPPYIPLLFHDPSILPRRVGCFTVTATEPEEKELPRK